MIVQNLEETSGNYPDVAFLADVFLGNGRKPTRSCCACRLSKNMEKRILILIGLKPLQKWDQVGIKYDKMGMVLERFR